MPEPVRDAAPSTCTALSSVKMSGGGDDAGAVMVFGFGSLIDAESRQRTVGRATAWWPVVVSGFAREFNVHVSTSSAGSWLPLQA